MKNTLCSLPSVLRHLSSVIAVFCAFAAASGAEYAHFDADGNFVRVISAEPSAVNLSLRARDGLPRTVPLSGTYDPTTQAVVGANRAGTIKVVALSQEEIDRRAAENIKRDLNLTKRDQLIARLTALQTKIAALRAGTGTQAQRMARVEADLADCIAAIVWLAKRELARDGIDVAD